MPQITKYNDPPMTVKRYEQEPARVKYGPQSRKSVENRRDKNTALVLLGITAAAYLTYKLFQASGAISSEVDYKAALSRGITRRR